MRIKFWDAKRKRKGERRKKGGRKSGGERDATTKGEETKTHLDESLKMGAKSRYTNVSTHSMARGRLEIETEGKEEKREERTLTDFFTVPNVKA